jgi:signal transduction histidine kinase
MRRSIEAAEAERRRFAHELHDQTLQGLGALAMMLDGASPDDREALVSGRASALRLIEDEVENLRRIIADLRPAVLDEFGLAPALEVLIERVREEHEIAIEAALDMPADAVLSPAAEQTIYRMVQEGLTNVCRHADASRAVVGVRVDGDRVLVRVEDDGRGFDPTSATGFGLVAMRERLSLLGASLEVRSGAGGTVLEAAVPVDAG